jgi:hypothetical protein
MAQTSFALDDTHPADPQVGFDIGWDHARHGLPPPAEQWLDGNPLHQGWRAGRACFGERTLHASRRVRLWLALRLHAWLRGRAFEPAEVTPHYLGQIEVLQCPITRRPLVQAESSVDRVNHQAGYAAGNLAMMSTLANRAKGALGWHEALVRAHQAEGADGGRFDGLDAAAWARVAVLTSFVTPLPHEQAARLPLRVLPPNRLRLLNPVQGLQALVTRELGRPDGTRRLRELAALLPSDAVRLDFHRFLSALLPRRLEAGRDVDAGALRHALEDAWCDARVNRCWQRFALQLDQALIERLLQRCAAGALSGTRVLLHEPARATEGWALDSGGWAAAPGQAGRRVLPRQEPAAPADRARIAASRSRTVDGHLPA